MLHCNIVKACREGFEGLIMSSLSKTLAPLWRACVSDDTDGPLDMGTSGEEKESRTKFGWIFDSGSETVGFNG